MPKKIILDIDNEVWEKFKGMVSKNETMNEAIVKLIKKEIGEVQSE
jgi:macrodomain Ter protein organizer (MatP/YcbG family)